MLPWAWIALVGVLKTSGTEGLYLATNGKRRLSAGSSVPLKHASVVAVFADDGLLQREHFANRWDVAIASGLPEQMER